MLKLLLKTKVLICNIPVDGKHDQSLQVTAEIDQDPCTFQVGAFDLGDIDKFKFGEKTNRV